MSADTGVEYVSVQSSGEVEERAERQRGADPVFWVSTQEATR